MTRLRRHFGSGMAAVTVLVCLTALHPGAAYADAPRKVMGSAVPAPPFSVPTTDGSGVSPYFTSLWNLQDGPRYTSYHFAVYLDGQTAVRSDATRRICVSSQLTGIDANDGNYYIRLHNEYTPSSRSSGYTGYVSFPANVGGYYVFCWNSLPDYDPGDVYVVQMSKANTTHYYNGNLRISQS